METVFYFAFAHVLAAGALRWSNSLSSASNKSPEQRFLLFGRGVTGRSNTCYVRSHRPAHARAHTHTHAPWRASQKVTFELFTMQLRARRPFSNRLNLCNFLQTVTRGPLTSVDKIDKNTHDVGVFISAILITVRKLINLVNVAVFM